MRESSALSPGTAPPRPAAPRGTPLIGHRCGGGSGCQGGWRSHSQHPYRPSRGPASLIAAPPDAQLKRPFRSVRSLPLFYLCPCYAASTFWTGCHAVLPEIKNPSAYLSPSHLCRAASPPWPAAASPFPSVGVWHPSPLPFPRREYRQPVIITRAPFPPHRPAPPLWPCPAPFQAAPNMQPAGQGMMVLPAPPHPSPRIPVFLFLPHAAMDMVVSDIRPVN